MGLPLEYYCGDLQLDLNAERKAKLAGAQKLFLHEVALCLVPVNVTS